MAYGGFLYDLLVVPMLFYRPTRWIAVALSVGFHVFNGLTLDIGVFPWFMLATLVVFFPIDTLRHRLNLFFGNKTDQVSTANAVHRPTAMAGLGAALASIYVIVNLLLPIRPWVYPGDANWNERGQRFAWRMMLRDKHALTTFLLVDANSPEYIVVPSSIILTPNQMIHADVHPDLVRQTAVELRKLVREEFGVEQCSVHALALTSLNGRRPAPLVDPTVDLSEVSPGRWREWITEDPGPFLDPPWVEPIEQWWIKFRGARALPDAPRPTSQRTATVPAGDEGKDGASADGQR